jgi:SAM-dependent methyltransferase
VSLADREHWRHRHQVHLTPKPPARVLSEWERVQPLKLKGEPSALDLACGQGHNALQLASWGYHVHAIDLCEEVLNRFQHPLITKSCLDLDNFRLPANTYDLILQTYFLDRRLFPQIQHSLKPGGYLLMETFLTTMNPAENPHHHLEPNELLRVFSPLRVWHYQECVTSGRPTAILIAQREEPFNRLP